MVNINPRVDVQAEKLSKKLAGFSGAALLINEFALIIDKKESEITALKKERDKLREAAKELRDQLHYCVYRYSLFNIGFVHQEEVLKKTAWITDEK